jgi:putative aldouronate transport system substrate-binding protein
MLFLVLAVIMLFMSLAGCSGSSDPTKESATAAAGTDTTTSTPSTDDNLQKEGMPIVKTPVILDVLTVRWSNMNDSFKTNAFLKELEKTTNVKINWDVKTNTDWDEQKNILLASGELPDVILGDLTMYERDVLSNIEYFLPLDNLIEQYMPNFKAAIAECPYMKKYVTYPDGKIYSLSAKLPCRANASHQPVINKAWLDRLKLQVPTNIDELYSVLKAFKDKDANGNGDPNDEIPFTGTAVNTIFDPSILILFGINDINSKYMIFDKDGKAVYYPATEQFKLGVQMLNKWYKEGIMDNEYFTQDWTMLDAKYKSTPSRVGFCYAWTPDSNFSTTKGEYLTIPPLTGYDGKKYATGDPNGISFRRMAMEITKFCKYPEVAARWADQFYTNEATIQNFWGGIGTVIKKNDDGTYQFNNPPEGTGADLWYWNSSLRDFGPKYSSPDFETKILLPKDSGDGIKLELSKMANDYITKPFPNVMYSLEENAEMETIRNDIEKFVQSKSAKWITEGGIEEEWDAYIKKMNDMNLKKLVEINIAAYNRFEGK